MSPALALLALVLAADPRARLELLKARKAAEEAAALALGQREGSILSALDASEQGLLAAANAARAAEAERAAAERRLGRAREDEVVAQSRLAGLEAELSPRLRARARLGQLSELRLLAASSSLAELVKRRWLWERVVAHDLALLAAGQRALEERERARRAVEAEAGRIAALARAAQERRDELASRREEHRMLLAAVRGERSLHERAAVEAAGQGSKLAEFVAALPPAASGAPLHTGFAGLRGHLPHPVTGQVEVGFGRVVDPRFETVTLQKGVDIRADGGAEVRAVAPGRVAHAGWFKGYGNLVIVDHGDGFHTLVAHLASMSTAMGEEVEAGALLGTVGDTGSLKGPYLYFEIRERGRSVDPASWLRP
ncbi:MAG TPA: peptidoglycan DD-metalloendopeptidase family protein [Anaeromyxobacteraceae bacterium]